MAKIYLLTLALAFLALLKVPAHSDVLSDSLNSTPQGSTSALALAR
ncbi:MAG: hypothetical protein AAF221_07505 [Pseudomonadota bacterium]